MRNLFIYGHLGRINIFSANPAWYAGQMAGKPQELTNYSSDELVAFAAKFEKLAALLRKTAELMTEKGVEEIYASYPRRVQEAMTGVNSMDSSFDKSFHALLSGKPLKASSVSPRSIRRAQSKKDDVDDQIKKLRATKKKG